ncbi:MAG: RtcB family protein, partial [Planctomycetota bacterium]
LSDLVQKGVKWALERGFGHNEDKDSIESEGYLSDVEPSFVSETAFERGREQIGTLGSGNHFLEIDIVDKIYDKDLATYFELQENTICILIHSGSRGFGHQICEDYIKTLTKHSRSHNIEIPDRQLICAPFKSSVGQQYFLSMNCAANFAFVNRQILMHFAKEAFLKTFVLSENDLGIKLIYDVCHNMAKVEEHNIDGEKRKLVIHRKGATRALPKNHPLLPKRYNNIGQPVIIPGDMGRYSFLCIGLDGSIEKTFGSTCHGAGRVASRSKMIKQMKNVDLKKEMLERGVIVMAQSRNSIAEEMPQAYKDVSKVVDVMENLGVSKKIVRLKPISVVKG